MSAIIRAIPNDFVIVSHVIEELNGGTSNGRKDNEFLTCLVDRGLINVGSLGKYGTSVFEQLVSGIAARTLDDGEAATIALAVETGGIALIDERKATNLCAESFPNLSLACTVDLFVHSEVQSALGQPGVVEAVFNALRKARMSVREHHLEWIASIIGPEKTKQCTSLPRWIRETT
jgi:predicted nucleic acid-binding protein